MKSIKILTSYKVLELTSIETTESFIRVRGDDFSSTKFCIVDGKIVTDFALSSTYVLLIYPPEGTDPRDVKFVAAVAESETVDEVSLMNLGLGYDVREVSGVMRLVQLFVFCLLTTAGSYILNKSIGGSVLDLMRKGSGAAPDRLLPDLVAAIRKTEEDIRRMQAGLNLPANELLLAVTVISTSVNASDSSITAFVELVTLDGSRRAFNIGI